MSEWKKQAYETSSEEDSLLASKGSAAAIKRKKVPSQKFLPAYHVAYPSFGSFEEREQACSLHHLQIKLLSCKHGSRFDCKQPVESKSYKEFKATGIFFPASSLYIWRVQKKM